MINQTLMTNFNQSDYLVKWTFLRHNNKITYNGEQHSMFCHKRVVQDYCNILELWIAQYSYSIYSIISRRDRNN
jgi:hypothetical protein